MSKAILYYERARALDREGLQQLWRSIQAGTTGPEWPPGKALEYFLLRGFELEGAEVVYPYEVYKQSEVVEQIDGLIFWKNFVGVVECKQAD